MKMEGVSGRTAPVDRRADHGMSPHADHKGRLSNNIDEGSFIPQFHQSSGDR